MAIKRINPIDHTRFNQFLRDNDIASKYYVNRAKQACKLSKCYRVSDLTCLCGFNWGDTPEGGRFWSAVDSMWVDICKQENIE